MKKILSFFCALMMILNVSAVPQVQAKRVVAPIQVEKKSSLRAELLNKAANLYRAPQAKKADLASGTYYTTGGNLYVNTNSGVQDRTSSVPSVEVTVTGTSVTIAGLAYYFDEGTITGTMNGNTITFASGQLVGSDEYGDEYLLGSQDGKTISDIVFTWDPDAQTLTSSTTYILESASDTAIQAYCYWNAPVFSIAKPAEPYLVQLPEGATVVEYKMDFTNSKSAADSKYVNVAVVGDSVYFQGMSGYLPEAWVVGAKKDNAITFKANQYMGVYSSLTSFAFYNGDAVFTYDPAADTYSAKGNIYGVLGGQYYDGNYTDPVLSKAGTPDYDNAKTVQITKKTAKYDAEYSDIIYKLYNATADTSFVLDIYVSGTDVMLGKTYTLDSMETSSTYTYIQIGTTKTALKEVSFVKTIDKDNLENINATVVDNDLNVYYLKYVEDPTAGPDYSTMTVEVPAGLETETYKFVGMDTYENEETSFEVQVGFVGSEVYIQGLSIFIPDAWVKGTLEGNVLTIPGWNLGEYASLFGSFELIFSGATMNYDKANDKFTCSEYQSLDEDGNAWDEFADVVITKIIEVAATPAKPAILNFVFADTNYPKVEFEIPTVGTKGEDLLSSKLSYIFFTDKAGVIAPLELTTELYTEISANMTEIPYNFTDNYDIIPGTLYLNQDETEVRSWDKLGLQSIYRGGNAENKSEIFWFDVKAYWAGVDSPTQAVSNVEANAVVTKKLINGQLVIEKNGAKFNVLGVDIK